MFTPLALPVWSHHSRLQPSRSTQSSTLASFDHQCNPVSRSQTSFPYSLCSLTLWFTTQLFSILRLRSWTGCWHFSCRFHTVVLKPSFPKVLCSTVIYHSFPQADLVEFEHSVFGSERQYCWWVTFAPRLRNSLRKSVINNASCLPPPSIVQRRCLVGLLLQYDTIQNI